MPVTHGLTQTRMRSTVPIPVDPNSNHLRGHFWLIVDLCLEIGVHSGNHFLVDHGSDNLSEVKR